MATLGSQAYCHCCGSQRGAVLPSSLTALPNGKGARPASLAPLVWGNHVLRSPNQAGRQRPIRLQRGGDARTGAFCLPAVGCLPAIKTNGRRPRVANSPIPWRTIGPVDCAHDHRQGCQANRNRQAKRRITVWQIHRASANGYRRY